MLFQTKQKQKPKIVCFRLERFAFKAHTHKIAIKMLNIRIKFYHDPSKTTTKLRSSHIEQ